MSKPEIGLRFPEDNANRWRGFNTPGIATFAGHRYRSLAREIAQNSLDARSSDDEPVHLEFALLEVPSEQIPNIDEFKATFEAVLSANKELDNNEKAQSFFTDSLKALSAKSVKVLRVTDTNTTGLVGPCEVGKPFFALVKAEGQTVKTSDTAGGSYGIGKFAPYTLSRLRTVFFSTTYKNEQAELVRLVQGRSILTSHNRGDQRYDAEGYWGQVEQFLPISGQNIESIPEWLKPQTLDDDTGTAIYIIGFNDAEDLWRERIVSSLAESFFEAVSSGNLTAEIEGFKLDAGTLNGVFQNSKVLNSLKDLPDAESAFSLSQHFLATLNSNNPGYRTNSTENQLFGEVRLHLVVDTNLPKRVGAIRNGMLITDRFPGLIRLNEFKPFVALLTFESDKGNALLRRMEPPAHDAIEIARLEGSDDYGAAKRELNKVSKWVRQQLTHFAKDSVRDTIELDELAELFPDDKAQETSKREDGEANPRGRVRIRSHPLPKPKKASSIADLFAGGQGGDVGEQTPGGTTGQGSTGDAESPGEGSSGSGVEGDKGESKAGANVPLSDIRAVPDGDRTRLVHFTPEEGGAIDLAFAISGADADDPLPIKATSEGELINGVVRVNTIAKNRKSLTIELTEPFAGTIKVSAHAV